MIGLQSQTPTAKPLKYLAYWYIYLPVLSVIGFAALVSFLAVYNTRVTEKSTSLYAFSDPSPTPFVIPNPQTQKWLLSAGAVLSVRNHENYDTLGSNLPKDGVQILLYDSWGVSNRTEALDILKQLKNQLHGRQFKALRKYLLAVTNNGDSEMYLKVKTDVMSGLYGQEPQVQEFLVDFTWQHRNDLAEKNLLAWDYMRLINVARWSYSLGFITENEAWEDIDFAGRKLQQNYTSWDDLGRSYILGRTFWLYSNSHPEIESAIAWLESHSSSPWKTIPWDLKL